MHSLSFCRDFTNSKSLFYRPGSVYATYDHALSDAEILDIESDQLRLWLLKYDMDSIRFHQSNLIAYDGVHSLLSDLIDAIILNKYNSMVRLPIFTLPGATW